MNPTRFSRSARRVVATLFLAPCLAFLGCSTSSTGVNSGYDALYPRPATGRPLIAYFYAPMSSSGPVGIHMLNTTTGTDALIFPGSVNGYDWVPGTDTLIVTTHSQILALATSSLHRTTLANVTGINCRVSSSGTKVVFDAAGALGSVVYVLDRRDKSITNVTPDSMQYQFPAWVGPTEQLLVLGTSPTASGLYFVTPTGAPRRRLTASGLGTGYPFTSPAGDTLVWAQGVSTTGRQLVVADSTNVTQRNLTACFTSGGWMPGSDQIVYSAPTANGARIWLVNVSTGVTTPLQP